MKSIIIATLFCISSIFSSHAQISGGFAHNKGKVYFSGTNNTNYTLIITVYAINEQLNNQHQWQFNLLPNHYFTIDNNNGWNWQQGEKLYIQFQNGQSIYWTNNLSQKSSSPSFKGKKGAYCTGDYHQCPCPGYAPYGPADWHCKHCGHPKNYHY